MEPSPFLLLFVTGVLPTIWSSAIRGYHLIQDVKDFDGAWAYCNQHFAGLAVVNSAAEVAAVMAEAQQHGFTSAAWIGMYNDVKSWRWTTDKSLLVGDTHWIGNEPNNHDVNEECAKIDKDGGWYDDICMNENPFVCYDAYKIVKYIYISSPTKTWKDALAYCRENHTDLACPQDNTENAKVQSVITKTAWMGLSRDSWKWADGSAVTFAAWKPKQPDVEGGRENICVHVNDKGLFSDDLCKNLYPFYCQNALKKLVRLKVQSIQDVNDPSVQAAVLQKVYEKLNELGFANYVKLTWRMQPDGKLFSVIKENKESNAETLSANATVCPPFNLQR